MPKSLLIVESPTKAKTLQKYLGRDFVVLSSKGHIKDLPTHELGVDLEQDFAPKYATILGKAKVIQELKKAAAGISEIFLGPDPDREGEAIAWHIAEALGEKDHRFHRVLLLELTQKAIKEALAHPVELDRPRYDSQQARRILDRLVGYQISPAAVAKGQDRPKRRAGCSPWPCAWCATGSGPSRPLSRGVLVPGRLPGRRGSRRLSWPAW